MSEKATSIPGSLPREKRRCVWAALACALIVAAGIAAWSNSFNGPFVFDDIPAIQDNITLRHFPARKNLIPPFPNSLSRRPVANFTFALNCALGDLDVRGFHAGNLLIHLLAALALFGIVRRTLLSPTLRDRFGRTSTGLATAVALIWAVHPLQTESVTYLTQRTESLMGLFYLLTLYCAIRGASSGHPWRWYAAAIAACALGMGAKEVMATAPIIVLLYDRCFLSGTFREALRRRLPFYLGLAATWAILGALLIAYPWGEATGAGFGLTEAGPWEYARTQPGVILNYLRLSFWPSPLCVDYSWPIATSAGQILPAAAAIAALLAATLWALRRAPALGFLGAWFFLILAPSSSFVPIITEVAAERRMYLPLAAIVTACVVAACRVLEHFLRRPDESQETHKRLALGIAALLTLCAAAGLGAMTVRRNAQYRTEISIWADATRNRPKNVRAWTQLGVAWLQAGNREKSFECLNKAIEVNPRYADAYHNRALAYASAGRSDLAFRDYCTSIELKPNDARFYNNRGVAYAEAGRSDEALRDWGEALKLNPDYAEAYNNRGNVCTQLGRPADAIRDYDRAIALNADFADAYYNRAIANGRLRRWDEAIRDYSHLLALNPDNAAACNGRGKMRVEANQPAEAIQDFDRAIALNPTYSEAYYNRGNARADANRRPEAIRDYDEAIALKPGFAAAYNNRAVAFYEMKAYDKAWADVKMFVALGGQPDPEFIKALNQAAGRGQ